ncbi:MAG: Gfo/Idh/MocA family oxidoreductase [Eubacteriales bacterium]
MRKIRIGQIGLGHNHGEGKMQAVRHFPEVFDIVGIADPDEAWLQKRGGLEVYRGLPVMSVEALLSGEKPDAVLVESDVWKLVPTAQRCIDAGVHVHMDKPAGEDIEAYARVLADAKAKGLTFQLGYMYRYNSAVKRCLEAVRQGELGEIFAINAEMSTQHSPAYREWLTHFQGGSMYIFGCHLIDLAMLILGTPDRVLPFVKSSGFGGVCAPDNCFAVLDYPKATAKITTASVEVNGWGRRQFVVCGSKGTIEIKPMERPTTMTLSTVDMIENAYHDCKQLVQVPETGNDNRYDEMMLDFAAMVRGEKQNPFTYDHELAVQKTVLQACGFTI